MKIILFALALLGGGASVTGCQEAALPVPPAVSYEGRMSLGLPYGDFKGGFVDARGTALKSGAAVGTNPGADVALASVTSTAVRDAHTSQAAWQALQEAGKASEYPDEVLAQAQALAFLSSPAFRRAPDPVLGLRSLNVLSEAQNPNAEVVLGALQLLGESIPAADRNRVAKSVSSAAKVYLDSHNPDAVAEGLQSYKPELANGIRSAAQKMEQAAQQLSAL